MRLWILNGPNLNLLGVREPEIYGTTTLAAVEQSCRALCETIGASLEFRQTNHEGVLVDHIQEAREGSDALIINPAGCSFQSVPVLDALKMYDGPLFELHISNLHGRDEHHRHSIMSGAATGVICGFGTYGYIVALLAAARLVGKMPDTLPEPIRTGPV